MNATRLALEKRIFISYFVITFILVMLIITVEWQLVRFSINQHENNIITKVNDSIVNDQKKIANEYILTLNEYSKKDSVIQAIMAKNSDYLESSLPSSNTVVYSVDKELLAGEYWDFIGNYHNSIFARRRYGHFLGTFGEKPFLIYFSPVYNEEELIGFLIDVKLYNLSLSVQDVNLSYASLSYSEVIKSLPEALVAHKTKIEDSISEMIKRKKQNEIYRFSINTAAGILIDYDIESKPVLIHLIIYNRYINSFAQKSIVFFVIVLLAISIMMISLLGNWFSKSILLPVKMINDRMKEIANNPAIIEPLQTNYQGVLKDMAETFNTMNSSIKEYSESLEEYKIISDHLNSGIFWLTMNFKVALCNPALLSIFHLQDKEEIIDKNINDFIQLKKEELRKIPREGIHLSNYEIKLSGRKIYVILNMVPIHSKGKDKIVGSITDVTSEVIEKKAREALEIELIKSNKLAEIGRRVEGIVHNMNSPLNSVLGYAQLLKKDFHDNKDIDKILESGKIISHYIKTLQQKIKKDTLSMLHPVDIVELVKQELTLCQHNLFFKHYIELETEFSDNLPPVYVVFGDISLCVANLLNNAIEALDNRPVKKIAVRVYKKDEEICVSIKDTGKGIEKMNLTAIFQPYFTTKVENDAVGYGLGLAICKHVADKYNGTILVTSEPNKGSEFCLTIPIQSQ